MRPGPGLVVMALAFISGARRGTSQQSSPSQGVKLGKLKEDDSTGSLARLNPWLSACDLAQPNSAPDLQGQCSAGTLPVTLVNEGPGPPVCPPACDKYFNNMNDNNNNNKKLKMENRFNEKQQCLDYFGDNDESPAQICKKSSRDIATKLRSLRLRHCCERTAYSAIHIDALTTVYKGGSECIRTLTDLQDADLLASRITCELNEILVRYDCRQLYSIKHGCRDCKEAYRRWVCSTLIPYFAEPDDIRQNKFVNNYDNTATTNLTSKTTNTHRTFSSNKNFVSQNLNTGLVDHETDPIVSRLLKRSRRKSETIRKRIRPCLSVCQTVEENCPYMLPGDRAPAHPTQYAGEPTFLCLDPNIPETGEQLRKSNTGSTECCYRYCGSVNDGICTDCNLYDNRTHRGDNGTIVDPEQCQSTQDPVTNTQPRCFTPFQASSMSSSSSITPSLLSPNKFLNQLSSRISIFILTISSCSIFYYYAWCCIWITLFSHNLAGS